MDVEVWKAVVGYDDWYDVSDWGRVRSWRNNHGRRRDEPLILSPDLSRNGYHRVTLFGGSRARTKVFVHRLVLEAFIGPQPFPEAQACHNSGDKSDNRPCNLRWDSAKNNAADRATHGSLVLGERMWNSALTDHTAALALEMLAHGVTRRQVAHILGVSKRTIQTLATGRGWKHIDRNANRPLSEDSVRLLREHSATMPPGEPAFGERHGMSKLTDATARKALQLISSGVDSDEVACMLRVSITTIRRLWNGYTWRHLARG